MQLAVRGVHEQAVLQVTHFLSLPPSFLPVVQRTLYHMNKVLLYSAASKNTVRIQDNRVNGKGGEGVLGRLDAAKGDV